MKAVAATAAIVAAFDADFGLTGSGGGGGVLVLTPRRNGRRRAEVLKARRRRRWRGRCVVGLRRRKTQQLLTLVKVWVIGRWRRWRRVERAGRKWRSALLAENVGGGGEVVAGGRGGQIVGPIRRQVERFVERDIVGMAGRRTKQRE